MEQKRHSKEQKMERITRRRKVKRKSISLITLILVLSLAVSSAMAQKEYKIGDYYDFEPELANAMKLNWYSSAENRAMLSLVLAIQVADNRVIGDANVFTDFLYNPSYIGRSTQKTASGNMNMYVVLGQYGDYFLYILYSPEAKQASFFLQNNTYGSSLSDMQMELLIAKLCDEYYKNETTDMLNAVSELQKLLK